MISNSQAIADTARLELLGLVMLTASLAMLPAGAADLHQPEPGEIVIMRAVTPQPHNRVDQQGPIISSVTLRPDFAIANHLNGPLDSLKVISLSDEEAAGVRASVSPGDMIHDILVENQNGIRNKSSLGGAANGRTIPRAGDLPGGRLTQVLGSTQGSGGAGPTNNAMKGFSSALVQALGSMSSKQ